MPNNPNPASVNPYPLGAIAGIVWPQGPVSSPGTTITWSSSGIQWGNTSMRTETVSSLKDWLNITDQELKGYFKLTIDPEKHYRIYKNKRGRVIQAPIEDLKIIQKKIAKAFSRYYRPSDSAHAYCNKKDIYTALENHCSKGMVVHLDIHNFFGSLTKKKFIAQMKDHNYLYRTQGTGTVTILSNEQLNFVADICFLNDTLPVGSPASPQISNFMMTAFDRNFRSFCNNQINSADYTRYADDIVISSQSNFHNYIEALYRLMKKHDLEPNVKKTRIMRAGKRQKVFNLILNHNENLVTVERYVESTIKYAKNNTKPRPSREYRRQLRAEMHQQELHELDAPKGKGLLDYNEKLDPIVLRGKFAWVNTIRNKRN